MSDATILDEKLRHVRRRWLIRDAGLCVARMLLVIIPLILLLGRMDYRWDFSHATRAAELAALLIAFAWTIRKWALPAIRRRRDMCATALCVESTYPQFGGRLVSRVQFRLMPDPADIAPSHTSRSLIDAACNLIEHQSAGLPLINAVDMRPLRAPVAGAMAAVLLLAGTVVVRPDLAGLWVLRTILPFADIAWPRRTYLGELQDAYRVRRGDSLILQGRVSGEIPNTVQVRWSAADAGITVMDRSADFAVAGDGAFTVRVGPLLEPIRLAVLAGDTQKAGIVVDVVRPPELAAIEAVYHYPEYTRRQPDRVQSGDVRALVGTHVQLTVTADSPTKRMELVFPDPGQQSAPAVELVSPLQGTAPLTVQSRGRYQIRLYDQFNFTADEPATFVIDPIDDELPVIKLTRPGPEHRVTPATRLRLEFEASDDYGVTGAAIRWHKRDPASSQPVATGSMPAGSGSQPATGDNVVSIPLPEPRTRWTTIFAWDMATAGILPGDELEYHVEVRDAGQHLTPEKVGRSTRCLLKVVDADTLSESLETRLREAFAEMDYVIKQQTASITEVSAAIVSLPTQDDPVVSSDIQRVQVEQNRQVRLARQVERLANRIGQTADELRDSFLADARRTDDLSALAEELRKLAAGPMESAAADLRRSQEVLRQLGASDLRGPGR